MKKKTLLGLALGAMIVSSTSLTAFAADGKVEVKGSIILTEPNIGPDGNYDVTIPSAVYWYVNDASRPVVVNGTIAGADSAVWGEPDTTVNIIKNNSGVDITTTFKSFDLKNPDATTVSKDLQLFLAGDLGEVQADLSKGHVADINIGVLEADGSFDFGFTGEYSGRITNSTNYSPEYTMTLGFSLGE